MLVIALVPSVVAFGIFVATLGLRGQRAASGVTPGAAR